MLGACVVVFYAAQFLTLPVSDPPLATRASSLRARSVAPAPALVCSAAEGGQRYGIATLDALFKYVLMDDRARPSFFETFVPGL
jgi:hypothetical protein